MMLIPDFALNNPKHRISNHPWPLYIQEVENRKIVIYQLLM